MRWLRGAWVIVAAAGCGGDGMTPAETTQAGVYFVPPRGPASSYEVDDVSLRAEGGELRLDYTLPRLLVGRSARVSFRGPMTDGAVTLTGSDGTATCVYDPAADVSVRCDERFTGLQVDLDGVRAEAQRVDPTQVEARVAVSRAFSIEPIGVLEVLRAQ